MQTKEWNFIDKATWGKGAWLSEPDKTQWTDAATGLPCLAVRNPHSGHWCGYVGVAEGHPLFGVGYGDAQAADGEWIDVHGGLTFSDFCTEGEAREFGICHIPDEGEPERVYWFGFDCAHLGDLAPARRMRERGMGFAADLGDKYRTLGYVKAECAKLATQLTSARNGGCVTSDVPELHA